MFKPSSSLSFLDSSFAIFFLLNYSSSTVILASLDWTCFSRNALLLSPSNIIVSKVALSLLLLLNYIWSFFTCSLNSSSLLTFCFLIGISTTYKGLASDCGILGTMARIKSLHLVYSSLTLRSLKLSDSMIITKYFQSCLIFFIT